MISILIILAYLCSKFDVIFYYKEYEQKIQRQKPVSKFIQWLFTETNWFGFKGVGRYRVLQKIIEVLALSIFFLIYFSLFEFTIWLFIFQICVMIVFYYLMPLERMYYYISETDSDLIRYERNKENVYWLKQPWFIGKFVFKKEFTKKKFDWCFWISIMVLFIASFV